MPMSDPTPASASASATMHAWGFFGRPEAGQGLGAAERRDLRGELDGQDGKGEPAERTLP